MPTETISWYDIAGGTSGALPTGTYDTGEVIASISSTVPSGNYLNVNTDGTNPDNNTSNPDNSQLSFVGTALQPVSLTMSFADDTAQTGDYGAYNATFGINDIDAGSTGSGHRDQVTIKAVDVDGNPLSINVTSIVSTPGYTVVTNPDQSVTITANWGTNSWNEAAQYAQITVNGGPIGEIVTTMSNVGPTGTQNIMMTNVTYETNLVVCFSRGTMIETDLGQVAVEDLQIGDLVRTADNGYQPVRWIGVNTLRAQDLKYMPNLKPIRISAGALGQGVPEQDLVVSPQHRMLVRSRIVERMFGAKEVPVAAKQLLSLEGVENCDDGEDVGYVHFLCDRHEVVYANGAPSETLFTGPQALRSVGSAARKEILTLFPELANVDCRALSARPLPSGRDARFLASRHVKNHRPLFSAA